MAEKFDGRRNGTQRKDRFVRTFVKSGSDGGDARKQASRMSVDELGREQQRRSVAYSRARGIL